jgi:hypothetical protein
MKKIKTHFEPTEQEIQECEEHQGEYRMLGLALPKALWEALDRACAKGSVSPKQFAFRVTNMFLKSVQEIEDLCEDPDCMLHGKNHPAPHVAVMRGDLKDAPEHVKEVLKDVIGQVRAEFQAEQAMPKKSRETH